MANIFDVAKYILDAKGAMTTMKLQKLCYYAQAWSLAWDEGELFPEEFEAWANGPVCRRMYAWHKGNFKVSADDLPIELLSSCDNPLNEDQRETIDMILGEYGDDTGHMLSVQTHSEDPWRDMRKGLLPQAPCDSIISKDSMRRYYGSL